MSHSCNAFYKSIRFKSNLSTSMGWSHLSRSSQKSAAFMTDCSFFFGSELGIHLLFLTRKLKRRSALLCLVLLHFPNCCLLDQIFWASPKIELQLTLLQAMTNVRFCVVNRKMVFWISHYQWNQPQTSTNLKFCSIKMAHRLTFDIFAHKTWPEKDLINLSICTWFLKNRVWNFFQKSSF